MMWEASRVRSFPGETRGAMLPAIMSMIFGFIIIVFLFWALGWALKVFGGWVNDGSTVIGNLIKASLVYPHTRFSHPTLDRCPNLAEPGNSPKS